MSTVYVRRAKNGRYNAHNLDGSLAPVGHDWKSATRLTVFMQERGYQVTRAPRQNRGESK